MSDEEHSEPGSYSNLSELKRQRGSLKGRLTLFEKYVGKLQDISLSQRQQAELSLRMETMSTLLNIFTKIQDKIEQLLDETEILKQLEYRESFEDQYFNVMSVAKCLISTVKPQNESELHHSLKHTNSVPIKLPQIKLPTFDGTYDNWLEFKNSYLSMIHKNSDLDAIQKFHYLKSSLSGSALQVISALEFTAVNYQHAWELLEMRYQNNRLLIHNHVRALFTAQPIGKESPILIRKLIDVVLRNLRALKSLDEPTDSWDTLLIYIVVSKLDSSTEREWEKYKGSICSDTQRNKIKLEDLLGFLRNRADMLDMVNNNCARPTQSCVKPNNINEYKKRTNSQQMNQSHSYVSTRNTQNDKTYRSTRLCVLCGANHALYSCCKFLNLPIQERINLVEEKALCRNCLRAGHNIAECSFGPCKQCQKKHNSLIHIDNNNNYTNASTPGPSQSAASARHSTPADDKPVSVVSCAMNFIDGANNILLNDSRYSPPLPQVLLSTALIEVMDHNNKYLTARALIDSGSQNSFISDKLCKRLNVPVIQSTMRISGVGQSVSQSNKLCDISMRSKTSEFHTQLRCFVLPCISSNLPSSRVNNYESLRVPSDICLADPSFYLPSAIDMLIGADVFWDLLDTERLRLPNGPYLQKSKLGWLLSGPINNNKSRVSYKNTNCNFVQLTNIDTQLRKFWELEEITSSDSTLSIEDRKCEELFVSTNERDSTGRFIVHIPLKEPADVLGESYEMAKSRFLSLERKLERSPSYKRMYSDFMREYVELGHMSPKHSYTSPCYFLPHHGVLREHSSTTKLRVVFDASATTTSNKSLNDIQMIGPPLQNDIFSILLRFRQFKYVACADVEKMFRQVLVREDQRNLQLILWRENTKDEIGIYQLNTVTYGTASAPYLSMRCLRQLALNADDKVVTKVITEDFFVDDLITGDDDPLVLSERCQKISNVLKSGCFSLRKWTFNHDINIKTSKELGVGENCQNKTLGLGWQVDSDELHFTTNVDNISKITKRSMMSVISQIYDPLGLLSPTIIIAKIMLQKLWLSKIDWDDEVPSDIRGMWERFIRTLSSLGGLRVPRYVMSNYTQHRELHIFTDASQDAYGACAYIRTYDDNSPITIHLLCAKSKVAPVKTVCTIPRLELCGALLGARLYRKISNSLRLTVTKVLFWTDSTIVMGWIRMPPHRLKTFVQNRVSQINDLTGDAIWLHINGKDNPADIVSRGLALNELVTSSTWWHGPEFLREHDVDYSNSCSISDDRLPELKIQNISMVCSNTTEHNDLINFDNFSSFNRLRRAVAYVLRFTSNCRAGKEHRKTGSLSVSELNESVTVLARLVQLQSFYNEHNDLMKNSVTKSKRISSLNVFLDESNLIRVGGRLNNSPLFDRNKKHPILLCSKHRFTVLLFRHEHTQLFHGGPQLLLASVRESWWPLGGRNLARKTVHDCVTCVRIRGKTVRPIMGNLPPSRLEPGFPFMRCGVDYAGPVNIVNRRGRGASITKGYICLFICLCTRAIHLELVTSLSTKDYILALKRFISRRGKPAEIMSDNGKNFVGAEKEFITGLQNRSQDIFDFTSNNSIKFSFIPPYAPHFGGLWEAGVKSCKHHLRRVIGCSNLTYEEFSTVLAQTEAILNSRPLTALSSDPNDLQPLTPAHFLIGRPLTAPACRDLTAAPSHRLLRYDVIEQMRQNIWKRWAKEYISELQTRTKWKTDDRDIALNGLALIKDDNLPPLKWKLGRIIRIYPGTDGISRVADLRTASGITRRACSRICPLPLLHEDADNKRLEILLESVDSKAGTMFAPDILNNETPSAVAWRDEAANREPRIAQAQDCAAPRNSQ